MNVNIKLTKNVGFWLSSQLGIFRLIRFKAYEQGEIAFGARVYWEPYRIELSINFFPFGFIFYVKEYPRWLVRLLFKRKIGKI